MNQRNQIQIVFAVLFLVGIAIGIWVIMQSRRHRESPDEFASVPPIPAYEARSFLRTALVPTLESPIPNNHNGIWSACFQYAWNELKNQVDGPVVVQNSSGLFDELNKSDFDEESVSSKDREVSVAKSGSALLIEAKIQLNVPFKFEFFDEVKPGRFEGIDHTESPVAVFGIREDEMYNTSDFRKQVDVLWDSVKQNGEFALDLCRYTEPYQLILARMPRPKSLAEAIEYHNSKKFRNPEKLHDEDMLLVPRMEFRLGQTFNQIDGQVLVNPKFAGLPIQTSNEVQWTLNKAGAKALASSRIAVLNGGPRLLSFDHPFLILVVNRETNANILAIWVENDELLTPFQNIEE